LGADASAFVEDGAGIVVLGAAAPGRDEATGMEAAPEGAGALRPASCSKGSLKSQPIAARNPPRKMMARPIMKTLVDFLGRLMGLERGEGLDVGMVCGRPGEAGEFS
jgi:hypothetical protein